LSLKEYQIKSENTASNQYHTDLVNMNAVKQEMSFYIAAGNNLDLQKKSIFYGAAFGAKNQYPASDTDSLKGLNPNITHAIYGLMTEASEFAEALEAAQKSGSFDKVNLKEEAGDIMWYLAMLFRELNTSFEEVAETNLNKLMARYPDKFSSEKAAARDLDKERKILED
jgi:NTP pyrophosphatase (non-canonical NTP hydrolase)